MAKISSQLSAQEMQQLAVNIIERLKTNKGRTCIADLRDLRKIAGTWDN